MAGTRGETIATPDRVRLAIAGISGRMGRIVAELAGSDSRFIVVAGLTQSSDPRLGEALRLGDAQVIVSEHLPAATTDPAPYRPCDVLIDFTSAEGTMHWLGVCEHLQIPMVIGATGHSEAQLARIRAAAHVIPIVKAANFSTGVAALINAARRLVTELGDGYDIEIVETHHRHKADAPSGTAMAIYEALREARGQVSTKAVFGRHGRTGERKPDEVGIHAVRMGEYVGRHEIHFSSGGETISLSHTAHSRAAFAAGALRAAEWATGNPAGLYSMQQVCAMSPVE